MLTLSRFMYSKSIKTDEIGAEVDTYIKMLILYEFFFLIIFSHLILSIFSSEYSERICFCVLNF